MIYLFYYSYIFYGVVAYGFDHYVAYIKRGKTWERHNDLVKKVLRFPDGKKKVHPHVLMYIQEN